MFKRHKNGDATLFEEFIVSVGSLPYRVGQP